MNTNLPQLLKKFKDEKKKDRLSLCPEGHSKEIEWQWSEYPVTYDLSFGIQGKQFYNYFTRVPEVS